MTAAARIAEPVRRPSTLAVFVARSEARALLWAASVFDLHQAIDPLQEAAVRNGLVEQIGQDRVQEIIAKAFDVVQQ
jgi:hypothetical protein